MDIKVMMLAIAVSIVILSVGGCIGTETEITTNSSVPVLSNIAVPQSAFKTMIISDSYGFSTTVITIVGNLTNIQYPDPDKIKDDLIMDKDILIFEDGTIVSTYGAKNFQWKLGKVYLIVIEDIEIRKVVSE